MRRAPSLLAASLEAFLCFFTHDLAKSSTRVLRVWPRVAG